MTTLLTIGLVFFGIAVACVMACTYTYIKSMYNKQKAFEIIIEELDNFDVDEFVDEYMNTLCGVLHRNGARYVHELTKAIEDIEKDIEDDGNNNDEVEDINFDF